MLEFTVDTAVTTYHPPRIVTGDGSSATAAEYLAPLGILAGPTLVVLDADVERLGLVQSLWEGLQKGGYASNVFSELRGEPSEEVVEALVDTVRTQPFTAVVGMGGGSAMDLAKLAATLADNGGRVRDYVGAQVFPSSRLPLVLVPTRYRHINIYGTYQFDRDGIAELEHQRGLSV